jgi:predicted small secreted protein
MFSNAFIKAIEGKIMRKLLFLGLIGSAFILSACNTVKGLGRDIESAKQVRMLLIKLGD